MAGSYKGPPLPSAWPAQLKSSARQTEEGSIQKLLRAQGGSGADAQAAAVELAELGIGPGATQQDLARQLEWKRLQQDQLWKRLLCKQSQKDKTMLKHRKLRDHVCQKYNMCQQNRVPNRMAQRQIKAPDKVALKDHTRQRIHTADPKDNMCADSVRPPVWRTGAAEEAALCFLPLQ